MKHLLWALCVISINILSIACKKNNNTDHSVNISGNWELAEVQSGMIPTISYPVGNGNELRFTNTNYQLYTNGQLIKNGTYSIISDASVRKEVCLEVEADKYTERIIYDNDTQSAKIFLQVSNDTLTFLSGCFALDGGSYKKYIRR